MDTICLEESWTIAPLFGGGVATINDVDRVFGNCTLALRKRMRNTGSVVYCAASLHDYNNENATWPGDLYGHVLFTTVVITSLGETG